MANYDILSLPQLMYCFIHPRLWKKASSPGHNSVITIHTSSKCVLVKSYRIHWVCSDTTNHHLRCVLRQVENKPSEAAFNCQCKVNILLILFFFFCQSSSSGLCPCLWPHSHLPPSSRCSTMSSRLDWMPRSLSQSCAGRSQYALKTSVSCHGTR